MQALILFTLAAVAPQLQQEPQRLPAPTNTAEYVDPRTPIDAEHTPGDADSVYRIAKPGSYFLTRDLIGQVGKTGIEVAASDVTIDLMGFHLRGKPTSLAGIDTDGSGYRRITVRNGSVLGFGARGIDLYYAIEACVEGLTANENGDDGIYVSHYSVVTRCNANENGGRGIVALTHSRILECTALGNGSQGIRVTSAGTVSACTSSNNAEDGIYVGGYGLVTDSISSANQEDGIDAAWRSQVRGCISADNALVGIRGGSSGTVERCEATGNDEAGIQVDDGCRVVGNVCRENGAPGVGGGIVVKGSYSTLEDNLCVQNDYTGFLIEGTGNFLRRNNAGGNAADWAVFVGNYARVLQATPSAGFLGSAGGVSPGPSDPNANYSL